jgi:archaellum biogenesis ATPase FlaH
MNTFEILKNEALKEADLEDKGMKFLNLKELWSMVFPLSRWAVAQIVPSEGITIISGAPASYKTWLILNMAMNISKGEMFLGKFQCEQANVLMIDEENHLQLIKDRLLLLGADDSLPIHFLSQQDFLITDESRLKQVLTMCQKHDISVIFIDSLVRVNRADENDASKMSEVFRAIRSLCKAGKTVVLTHHEKKEGTFKLSPQSRMRGSSDIFASVDAHLAISRDRDDKAFLVLEQAKNRRDVEIVPFGVEVKKDNQKLWFEYKGEYAGKNKKSEAREVILQMLEGYAEGMTRGDITKHVFEACQIGAKSCREAIDGLIEDKVINELPGVGNTKSCVLSKYTLDKSL